jgi:serine/threonine protein kinase
MRIRALSDCPHFADVQKLLADPRDEQSWDALQAHLDRCPTCRARIDAWHAANTLIPGLSDRWQPPASSAALDRAVARLSDAAPDPAPPAMPAGSAPQLSFLQPIDRAGYLGRLGNYAVRRLIGRGGMGLVLEAEDPVLQRTVAIKMISPWGVLDAEARSRFLREARAAAAITHENVVAIHAVEELSGTPFLVLEYVPGESLEGRLRRVGALPLKNVVRLGLEVARGLAAAHAKGLIHRDIKPANILLAEDTDRAKVADFGLAKMGDEDALTLTGTLLGTPEFMSPEQAAGQEPDERSDLFSLGAVLYVAATAVSPFRGATLYDTLDNVRRCQPRPLRELDASLPDWFCELVQRLLAKDPGARIGWASAVALLLEQASATSTLNDFLPSRGTLPLPKPAGAATLRSRPAGMFVAGGSVVLAALAGLGWMLWNPRPTGSGGSPQTASPVPAPEVQNDPLPPVIPIPPGFRIAGQGEHFATLAAAITAAQDGQAIEVYGNGPFLTPPITIAGKRLTIRAAPDAHPLIMEPPSEHANRPLLHSDTDLRLEGLEIHWSIESAAGLSEAELLARSIIVTTHGQLLVSHCRIVSERQNCCLAGTCRTVAIHHSHLVSRGMGLFWRPEGGGRLDIGGSILENRSGVAVLIDGIAFGRMPGQMHVERSTFATEFGIQLFLESPTRLPLPFAAERSLFQCDHLFFLLMPQRAARSKGVGKKVEEIPGVLRSWIAWSETANAYRRGLNYVSRAVPLAQGAVRSADIADLAKWLDFWKLQGSQSIEGEIRFQPRAESSAAQPLLLEAIDDGSGPAPEALGASPAELGPGPAYHAWRASPAYSAWPAAADRK